MTESNVYAVMIWLRSTDAAVQPDDPQLGLQEGHRSFVFNPPALSHIRYAHFTQREQALETLKQLGQELQEGRTLYVHGEQWSFAIPARSVLYVALGQSQVTTLNPDDGSLRAEALRAQNARAIRPDESSASDPAAGFRPALERWSTDGGHGRAPGPAEEIHPSGVSSGIPPNESHQTAPVNFLPE